MYWIKMSVWIQERATFLVPRRSSYQWYSTSVSVSSLLACLFCVFHVAAVCLLVAVCLSVAPDFPCLSHNSHPSYTAAQTVEERWAWCQSAGAPVGQSISSIKDMVSTQVYPPGLAPWSPVRATPRCPSAHRGARVKCTECLSCFISMAPRHPTLLL